MLEQNVEQQRRWRRDSGSTGSGGAIPAVPAIAVPVSGHDSNGAVLASGSRSAGAELPSF